MIPKKNIEDLINKHSTLEKELSSSSLDTKLFAEKSKEYSDLNEIIDVEKGKLAVLGDWQDDPSYAVFDGKELTLHQWENDA